MNKEKMIPFFAMAVLLVAMASSVYVYTVQSQLTVSADSIRIDDEEYSIDHLFDTIDPTTISLEEFDKTGIPLDNLIISTGLTCPSCHTYVIMASDGYQQTVTWENMGTGIYTEEHRVYFPGLAHSFWVRDVIEIKVE